MPGKQLPLIFAATLILMFAPAFTVNADEQADYTELLTTTQRYGDWLLRCEQAKGEKKSCVMLQKITAGSSGQEVLQANLAKMEQGTQMTLIFPLGIYLLPGIEVEVVDHDKRNFPITFCSNAGCFVNHILDEEFVELLRQKENAQITVYMLPDQPIVVPFSIAGFLDAHRALLRAAR